MCRSRRSAILFAASICLGVGLIGGLLLKAGPERIISLPERLSWIAVLLAAIIYSLSWFFRTWRLARFTTEQNPSPRHLFQIQIAGFALNSLLPMKLGDALIVMGLHAAQMGIGRATAIVVQLRVLDLFLVLTATAPLFFLEFHATLPDWVDHSISSIGALACLPLGFTWLVHRGIPQKFLQKLLKNASSERLRFLVAKINDACRSYAEIVMRKRLFAETILLTACIWSMEGLTTAALASSLGMSVPLELLFPAVAMANLSKAAPATPGGIGVYESVMALVLSLGGISFEDAIILALCDHVLKKAITLGFGLPCASSLLGTSWRTVLTTLKFKRQDI